jgi:hypothetical protein
MKVQITITRMDKGARTQIKTEGDESNKDYVSWDQALTDAEHIGLINGVELAGAKLLPPAFPFHTKADIGPALFSAHGFVQGKTVPPR